MEWLAVAGFVFVCFLVLPIAILGLRDRRVSERQAVDRAHLKRASPELWFGTPQYNARFDRPDFAALEAHIGRPLPTPLKELFLQADVVRKGCFIITPPQGSGQDELWIEQFNPIDRLAISRGDFRSAWVEGPFLPFASDPSGNEFQLAIDSMAAEDAIVHFYSIDPYTGKLLGTRLMEDAFFHYVLDLHRSLFAGMTGRLLVELTTSWGLILMLTGVYLWWPRGKARSIGVWRPRLSGKLYVVLRDLHAVFGFYAAGFAVLILGTGLFFSAVSGTGFNMLSAKLNQSLGAFLMPVPSPSQPEGARPGPLETVATTALTGSGPGDGVYIMIAEKPETAHKAYVMTDGDTNTVRGLDIDQFTGQLIKMTDTPDLTPMVRLLAIVESLHQGKTFGLPSKIIAFLTCLILVALSITGVWMWWQRRPQGESGFPKRPAGPIPKWVWATTIILGLLLPVAGASMILFLIADSFIQWRRSAA